MSEVAPSVRDAVLRVVGERIAGVLLMDGSRVLARLDVTPPVVVAGGRCVVSAATAGALDTGAPSGFECVDVRGALVASGRDLDLSDDRVVTGDIIALSVTLGFA